ncbi:sulfotransferase family protein [Persephonella sp.]
MPLPNFLCVGAQKAGTTTLYDILIQHPQIYLPDIKETKFFNERYDKGISFYEQFFSSYKGEKVIGEIDPDYMFFEVNSVATRIYKHLGKDLKLIFMLRNPVDRAYSQYWMNVRRGIEKEPFDKAIALESQRIRKNLFSKHNFSYISRGQYASQIKIFLEFFPIENMFFIIFEEDFIKNREKTIKNLLEFLDVEDVELNLNIKSNSANMPKIKFLQNIIYAPDSTLKKIGKVILPSEEVRRKTLKFLEKINLRSFRYPKMDESLRNYMMEEYFINDIKELETLIGRNLEYWYR